MSEMTSILTDLASSASRVRNKADKLTTFVDGAEDHTVELGGDQRKTLRGIIRDLSGLASSAQSILDTIIDNEYRFFQFYQLDPAVPALVRDNGINLYAVADSPDELPAPDAPGHYALTLGGADSVNLHISTETDTWEFVALLPISQGAYFNILHPSGTITGNVAVWLAGVWAPLDPSIDIAGPNQPGIVPEGGQPGMYYGVPEESSTYGFIALPPPPATFPVGGIIIWSGSGDNIPEHWALCDGTNGTPDLRNRFVLGASPNMAGNTGGSGEITISASTGGTALSVAQLPSHTHNGQGVSSQYYGDYTIGAGNIQTGYPLTTLGATGSNQAHSHSINITAAHLPPYYSLAYIMFLGPPEPVWNAPTIPPRPE